MYDSGSALVARLRAAASVAHIRLEPGKPPNAAVTATPATWKGWPFSVIVWPRRRFAASANDRSTTTPPGRIHVPSVTLGWSTAATPGLRPSTCTEVTRSELRMTGPTGPVAPTIG